jgi:hypothetical protein
MRCTMNTRITAQDDMSDRRPEAEASSSLSQHRRGSLVKLSSFCLVDGQCLKVQRQAVGGSGAAGASVT